MENQNVILNLENIEEVLVRNGININNLDENQKKLYMFLMQEIRNTTVKVQQKDREINDLRTQIQFTNATILNMQNRQNTADQHIANANGAINNTNAHLNAVDARLTLTEQNLNLLKNQVTTITEQALRNGEIPNPIKPTDQEKSNLKDILGEEYYRLMDYNYKIATRDDIEKAAKQIINKAILACKVTETVIDERRAYQDRQKNRDRLNQRSQRFNEEINQAQEELDNLNEDRSPQRTRIADSVKRGQVNVSTLNFYDSQTETQREELKNQLKKIKSDSDLHEEDVKKLESEVVTAIKRIGKNGSYVGEIIELTGVVINVSECIKKYIDKKQAEARQEERFKNKAKQLETELIAMTIDRRKETFEKINTIYLARYYATLGRDDVSYEKTSNVFTICGNKKYSNIPNYEQFYSTQSLLSEEKIKYLKKLMKFFPNESEPETFETIIDYTKQKNHSVFINQEKREEFNTKYQLYRALMKTGEFFDMKDCGDNQEVFRGLLFGLIPIYGWIVGIPFGIDRCVNELKWKNNIPKLKEVMKIYLVVVGKLEEILKTKCVHSRLKYYNDWTKSKYGEDLLKKNEKTLNVEFPNEDAKQKFEECFDLYQKIANEGIADRWNYVNNTFEYRNIERPIVVNQIV